MSAAMATQSEHDPPFTREIVFAPGELEKVLDSLGFSLEKLKDNNYLLKAVDAIGGSGELEAMTRTFRYLVSLPRSQLSAELMVRTSIVEFSKMRDRLRFMEMADIASLVIHHEVKNRHGHLHAELAGMT